MVLMHTDHGCIRHRALSREEDENEGQRETTLDEEGIVIVPVAISGISRYVRESRCFPWTHSLRSFRAAQPF
jgi:hypothetical protein